MDCPYPITSPIFRKRFSHQTITFYTVVVQLIRVENCLSSPRGRETRRQKNIAIIYGPKFFSPGSGNKRYIRQRSSGHFLHYGLGSASGKNPFKHGCHFMWSLFQGWRYFPFLSALVAPQYFLVFVLCSLFQSLSVGYLVCYKTVFFGTRLRHCGSIFLTLPWFMYRMRKSLGLQESLVGNRQKNPPYR